MSTTNREMASTKALFFNIGFPGELGRVEETHVHIQSPGGENAELYRNRRGYFSLNVQVVSNAKLEICDIVARWPGSSHDSTIFLTIPIFVLSLRLGTTFMDISLVIVLILVESI